MVRLISWDELATALLERTRLNVTVYCQSLHAKNARHMLVDIVEFFFSSSSFGFYPLHSLHSPEDVETLSKILLEQVGAEY